jgi:predicted transcriptional regulator
MTTSTEYRGRNEIIAQILQTVSDSGIKGISRTLIKDSNYSTDLE